MGSVTLTERVRILSKRPENRTCADCEQLGPTYVNCTIGSFVCTTCSGILRGLNPPHRIKSVGLSKFTLHEVEFMEQYGNENVEGKWMGKYDQRCGKKVSKDSPLYRTYLEDKYERKCWFDDAFKFTPKTEKVEEKQKPQKNASRSNSGTYSTYSRDAESELNRNDLYSASLGGDSGFSNDDFFADFDSVNWQTINDKDSNKQSANCSNSLVEPFQSMSFLSGDDVSASKAAPALPTPVIFSQQSFTASTMTSHTTQPVQNQMYSSPAHRNPFLDPQSTPLSSQKQTFGSQETQPFHHQNVFASPHVQQPFMYSNQSSSPATSSADRYSALADLDATVKAEAMNARRAKLQKQVSVGQQIFGAAPSSANPFLNPKRQSSVQYSMPSQPIAPSCMFSSNPFSSGDPTNPFL